MALLNVNFASLRKSATETLYSDEWLPLLDAAAIAKIPVKSLRKDVREGRVRAFGRPRRLRVRMADVLPQYTPPAAREPRKTPAEPHSRAV